MADRVGFKVEGLDAVLRDLRRLGLDINDLKDAFAKIAAEGAQKVQTRIPRRSGRLAGTARGNRAKSKAVVRVGSAAVPYAGPINYGWPARSIEPAGFMQDVDQDMRPIAVQRLEDDINAKIRQRGLNP
ncbi:MAG TPA: hypothetical protein VMF51_08385 [Nocardioides sp.]|uniref:hypothetical protein n=1 Tax=Nocardioides sp. TaxID=35761 RepID=UPI002C2F93D9|nr:hypothetical protein [Nocardioides sp.]HTW15133.1 hypothetical protein [Nocardioides sp.]